MTTLCDSAVMLDSGRVVTAGRTQEVIAHYMNGLDHPLQTVDLKNAANRRGSGEAESPCLAVRQQWGTLFHF